MPENLRPDELQHYGVLGMKWGVHRATRKVSKNEKLIDKALKYDVKQNKWATKSEKTHRVQDLDRVTNLGVKAAKAEKKAAEFTRRAKDASSIDKQLRYEKRAAKQSYKAANLHVKGDEITKAKGYGAKAMSQLNKSNRFAKKAAKARLKIAKNEVYINSVKKKASEVSKTDLDKGYAFMNEFLKEPIN